MDWLEEEVGEYEDDYLIIDCPGQIELYTHHPFLPTLVKNLQRLGMRTSAVYLLESQFMEDKYKFFRCVIGLLFRLLAQQFCICLPHPP
jgi:GTPase SAR1 family protein